MVRTTQKSDNAPSRVSSIFPRAETNLDIAGVENIIETVSCSENPHVVDQ